MLYLIHLDQAMRMDEQRAARHYIGFVDELGGGQPHPLVARMRLHRSGKGARFLAAANEKGITWHLASVQRGGRSDERRFKDQANSNRYCPRCALNIATNPRADSEARRIALGIPGGVRWPGLEEALSRMRLHHLSALLAEYK